MSVFASALRAAYKLSGAKKAFDDGNTEEWIWSDKKPFAVHTA